MPQLPNWTDAQSVTSYVTSLIAFVLSVVTTFHPGFTEPAVVQSVIPAVGLVVAGIAQAVNVFTHRAAHALATKVPIVGPPGEPGPRGPQGIPGNDGKDGASPEFDESGVIDRAADVAIRRLAASAESANAPK